MRSGDLGQNTIRGLAAAQLNTEPEIATVSETCEGDPNR